MTSGLSPPPGPTTRTCCFEVPDAPTGLPGAALPPSPCIVFLLPPGGRTGGATMVLRFAYTCRSLFHMFGCGMMSLPSASVLYKGLLGRCFFFFFTDWSDQVSSAVRSVSLRGQETSAMTTRKQAGVGGEVSGRESTETPPPPHLLCSQSSVQGGA